MKFLSLFWSTIMLRPYVFAFFVLFFISAVRSLGWKRSLVFTLLAGGIAFSAEYSSTRIGFPFGLYHYIEATRNQEIWVFNIPFMDSLSFTFVAYASYALALHLCRSQKKGHVLLLSALLFVLLDIVIDPLALRGDRWFLGKIYYYPEGGLYFGVPLANFFGWGVVGFSITGLFQTLDRRLGGRDKTKTLPGLGGSFLYFLILLSGVGMTFYIGEPLLGAIGLLLSLSPLAAFFYRLKGQLQAADHISQITDIQLERGGRDLKSGV